ncbi:MAG: pantetheine-phosphate adenylyltransferase [Peptococcaceae bacterium]
MRTAIYPGTFNPITNGHLDILYRAMVLFDKVIIAVAQDHYQNTLFTLEERLGFIQEETKNIPNVEAQFFSGLLVDIIEEHDACAIIRGLGTVADFEYEFQLASLNRKLVPQVETIFFMTSINYSFLSSNIVNNIAALKGCIKGLVPLAVENALNQKFSEQINPVRERRKKNNENTGI